MAIPVGGLATGLDTESLTQRLLAFEKRPITLLETRKLKLQALSTAFQDLNTKLLAVKSATDALKNPATFFPRSVASSAESVATATASPGANQGAYSLTVTALARNSIAKAGQTKSALTDAVATSSGDFQLKIGPMGAVVTVAVTANTTLIDLVTAINDKNVGVKANALNVGTTEAPAYQLTLTSNATGAANNIVIVNDPTALSVTNTQTALDAAFTVAGIGSFTRSTNTFSDVIEGVTITVKASNASADLTVSVDKTALQSRLQAIVDAYNTLVRTIDSQSAGTKGTDGKFTPGAFTGDVVPRQLRRGLGFTVATQLGGTYKSLAELGITTSRDGTLALDGAKFQKAVAANAQAVSDLVAGTSTTDGIGDLLSRALDNATKSVTGAIAARQDGITTSIRDLQKQIDSAQERLEVTERALRARFENLEKVVVQLQSSGDFLERQLQALPLNTQLRRQ